MRENRLGEGATHVYTGDGKGKTTAALGLALRAVGRDLEVLVIQFMKRWGYGEHLAARRLEPELEIVQVGEPYFAVHEDEIDDESRAKLSGEVEVFSPGSPPEKLLRGAADGLQRARAACEKETHDVIILDEINVALHYGLTTVDDVLDLIHSRPRGVELVLTGRRAPKAVLEAADLVTEMCEVKHYWRRGWTARPGIEE